MVGGWLDRSLVGKIRSRVGRLECFSPARKVVLALQGVEKPCSQAGQKGPRCEAREKSTSGSVLRQYVGATPIGAEMISAPIEHDYSKRLPRAGWRQMGLFQRSVY
jgi:hypothetical protein